MWDCDIESDDWFRRFESRYFADDFTDFEEMQEIEDAFMDIDDQSPRELMGDYETLKDVGVGEFSSFVYGYSMIIEYDYKPRVRKIRNEGVGSGGSSKKREGVSELRQHIASERESLAEINIYDKVPVKTTSIYGHMKIR